MTAVDIGPAQKINHSSGPTQSGRTGASSRMDGQPQLVKLVACCLIAWLLAHRRNGLAAATDKYTCPDEYQLFSPTCYRLVADSDTDGVSARTACQAALAGSHLVYIESAEVQAFLQSVADVSEDYWIGLTFTSSVDSPHWLDGSPLGNYTAWDGDEVFNENSPCVRLRKESTPPHMWNDRSCTMTFGYICQIEAETAPVETTTPVQTTTTCDPGNQAGIRSSHYHLVGQVGMAAPADFHLIRTLAASSLRRCAADCSRRADCLSFSYRAAAEGAAASEGLGNCRLHARAFSAGELTEQAGYLHYRL